MTDDPIKTWAKDLRDHFSREDVHLANQHTNMHRISSVVRKLQVKTITRWHFTPTRMARVKEQKTCVGKLVQELEPLRVSGEVNYYQPL